MRTENDVMRSVKRYMAIVLGPTWEVRMWTDEGSFQTPLARVAASAPATYTSRRILTDIVLPIQVHCYLPDVDTVSAGLSAALACREQIIQGIEIGVDLGWPRRIPLYDYDGVDDAHGSEARNTYDFIRVIDLSVNSIPDTDEPTDVVVVADMRLGWGRGTTVNPDAETVESVRVSTRAG